MVIQSQCGAHDSSVTFFSLSSACLLHNHKKINYFLKFIVEIAGWCFESSQVQRIISGLSVYCLFASKTGIWPGTLWLVTSQQNNTTQCTVCMYILTVHYHLAHGVPITGLNAKSNSIHFEFSVKKSRGKKRTKVPLLIFRFIILQFIKITEICEKDSKIHLPIFPFVGEK